MIRVTERDCSMREGRWNVIPPGGPMAEAVFAGVWWEREVWHAG